MVTSTSIMVGKSVKEVGMLLQVDNGYSTSGYRGGTGML